MVMKNKKAISVILAMVSAAFLISGCSGTELPYDLPETFGKNKETEKILERVFGQNDRERNEDSGGSEVVINGPDTPPEGMRYDEWKGITYSSDTSFPVRTYWVMGGGRSTRGDSAVQDPETIEDGVIVIKDAKAEPVGGEMKLRSGGYVDITIETLWTGTMRYFLPAGSYSYVSSFAWEENPVLPFDAYTGTSLINDQDNDDQDTDEINIGEAINTGMVESSVTWNNHTYRLYAKKDTRNASFSNETYEHTYNGNYISVPGTVETTLTLRVPADYDGIALAIDKDIVDEKSSKISPFGTWLKNSDVYADILTTDNGVKQTADDFYFIKVSDLLDKFN